MKKTLTTAAVSFLVWFAFFSAPAAALPQAEEYKNSSFDVGQIRRVLVMPVKIPAGLREQSAKKLKYRWGELINMKRGEGGYAVLTPDQLLRKHYAAQGVKPRIWENDLQRVSYVNGIVRQYADAVLTMTVISCGYSSIAVPERYASGDEYREVKDWDENGRITSRKELVTERTLRPAETVRLSGGSCRVELWSVRGGGQTLVYSCMAGESKSSALYGAKLPPPETVTEDLMEYVMKRVPVK